MSNQRKGRRTRAALVDKASDHALGMGTKLCCSHCADAGVAGSDELQVWIADGKLYVLCADDEHQKEFGPLMVTKLSPEFMKTFVAPSGIIISEAG